MIRHVGNEWRLYSKSGGKLLGRHRTRKEAEEQERAIEDAKRRRGR